MGEPDGQWKCWENSLELDRDPMTRKREGLCGSVMRPSWELSGVRTEHQTLAGATRRGQSPRALRPLEYSHQSSEE